MTSLTICSNKNSLIASDIIYDAFVLDIENCSAIGHLNILSNNFPMLSQDLKEKSLAATL